MDKRTKPVYQLFLIVSIAILVVIGYYYYYPFWAERGVTGKIMEQLVVGMYRSGTMRQETLVRLCCLFFCAWSLIIRSGSSKDSPWWKILTPLLLGLALFLGAPFLGYGLLSLALTFISYILFLVGSILLGRKYRSFDAGLAEFDDTFPQCEELIENKDSINLPIRYKYKGRVRNGYVNVVAPQRGCMVLGIPGSGKTYSIYGPFIRQMVRKGYPLLVYDYKYPDMSRLVLNELLDDSSGYEVKPKFYVINFDDPRHSHRFNPIHPRYLTDPIDSTEIAELIMKNVNRGGEKDDNFFSQSAMCYIDLLIWFLKIYEGGKYCSIPYLIELMGQDYRDVFEVLKRYDELEVKRNTFADAIKDQAFEQLQGQIASARVPLNRFASKTLYWTLSGDDFSLDINNPQEPKIICVGNNPKRQSIYGMTLALLMSQAFKQVNVPHKLHCGILIDELPTIYLKDLDNTIDTARSNDVVILFGAQDKSQLIRDYDKKESDVIFGTVGNVFAGAVRGKTAEELSRSFGKEDREMRSFQESDVADHRSFSYQLRDILPAHKIESLSQGTFCGYVADTWKQKVNPKIFCGEIQTGDPPKHNEQIPLIVDMTEEEMMAEVEKNYQKIRLDIVNLIRTELSKTPEEVEDEVENW